MPRFIAHAGGNVDGRRYTNSLNALDESYSRGFRYFEIDFEWTLDQRLVLAHDWTMMWPMLSGSEVPVPTHEQFMAATFRHGLKQLDLEALIDWMTKHPDAHVLTDVKSDNLRALSAIAEAPVADRFIPQVYDFSEHADALRLGFDRVILTTYRLKEKPATVSRFVADQRPWALMVPVRQVEDGAYSSLLDAGLVPLFTHTVNDPGQWFRLRALGVAGIITDSLFQPAAGDREIEDGSRRTQPAASAD